MKKWICILISFVVVLSSSSTVFAQGEDISSVVEAPYVFVYNLDSESVVFEKASKDKMYPASMTKMLSALVFFDKIEDMNELVTITEEDIAGLQEQGASVIGFGVGDTVSYSDLMQSLVIASAGDSGQTLAMHLYGSIEGAVDAMNQKAKELGMNDSHFTNTTGLHDDDLYTTAYDIYLLTRASMENEQLKQWLSTMKSSISFNGAGGPYIGFTHTIQLGITEYDILDTYITGGKTGFTLEAGSCLASFGEVQDMSYIVVIGGADYTDEKYHSAVKESNDLYRFLDENYKKVLVLQAGEKLTDIQLRYRWQSTYEILAQEDVYAIIPKSISSEELTIVPNIEEVYDTPLEKGTLLGSYTINHGDIVLYTNDVYLNETQGRDETRYIVHQMGVHWHYIVGGILLLITIIILFHFAFKKRRKNPYHL